MNTKHKGFTIVELLVVIVVIAILAAITLVSYNGIRDRAYNTQTISAASNTLKIIEIAYTSQGQIVLNDAIPNGGSELCVGNPADFPAKGDLVEGQCSYNSYASSELWDTLKSYGDGNLNTLLFDDGSGYETRGITYLGWRYKSDATYYGFLKYSLIGEDQDCAVSGAEYIDNIYSTSNGSNETSCWINMTKILGDDPIMY